MQQPSQPKACMCSLSCWLACSFSRSLSLSLFSRSLPPSLHVSRACVPSFSRSLTQTRTLTPTHTLTLSLAHTCTLTLLRSLTLTRLLCPSLPVSLSHRWFSGGVKKEGSATTVGEKKVLQIEPLKKDHIYNKDELATVHLHILCTFSHICTHYVQV